MKQSTVAAKKNAKVASQSPIALVPNEIMTPLHISQDRKVPQFKDTFEALMALDSMLDELVPMREMLGLMRVEFTSEEDRLRHMVKKYAGQHINAGRSAKVDEIRETIKRGYELLGHLENHFEDVVEGAPAHFDFLVCEIRKEDSEILEELADDLAATQKDFRNAVNSDDVQEVAEAYAKVNNLLIDTVEGLRAERDRKKIAEVQARAKKRVDRL